VGGTIPIPAPAPLTPIVRYRLVLVARDGSEGAIFPLAGSADIGRSEGDVVIPEDQYVSPRHARVTLREDAYFLRDLGSTNGVFVRIPFVEGARANIERSTELESITEQPLVDQELFLVGQQVLRFEVVKHADEGFGVAAENGTLLFGTPTSPRYGRITQRTVEGVVRDVFHVRKAEMVIGRESGDIVFTDDPFLSRRHAVLRVHGLGLASPREPTFGLVDLGSSNGTFLRIRDEVRLQPGTHFRIGQQLLRFDADPAGAGA
jgi:pSer/pThr/pTyr-binding forkhead associated (FHA) protein